MAYETNAYSIYPSMTIPGQGRGSTEGSGYPEYGNTPTPDVPDPAEARARAYARLQSVYQRALGRQGTDSEFESHLGGAYDSQTVDAAVARIENSPEAQAYKARQQASPPASPAPPRPPAPAAAPSAPAAAPRAAVSPASAMGVSFGTSAGSSVPTGYYSPEQVGTFFQSQYGRAATQQDVDRFRAASGYSGNGPISAQQYQLGMQALSGFLQQEGNLGAVYMPGPVAQPGAPQNFQTSIQQGQQLVGQYQAPAAATTPFQAPASQAANYAQQQQLINQLQAQRMGSFAAPEAGPAPDFAQQLALLNQLQAAQVEGFQAPDAVAQAERNRVLAAIIGQPDVFGAQQQAQMAEQQKEQLLGQQREAEARLGQLMAARGLSSRGGLDLAGQLGLQENLVAGLLAGQRDIALRAAEANRAAQLQAVQAVTGAQQADAARAAQAYQAALAGSEFNRASRQAALTGQQNLAQQQMSLDQQRFQQALGGFGANLQANEFNLGAARAALAGASALGAQEFAQAQQAYQMAQQQAQQGFQNYLAQASLGLQGVSLAEQAELARQQQQRADYENYINYLLRARAQEQGYGLDLRRLGLEEQEFQNRLYGLT